MAGKTKALIVEDDLDMLDATKALLEDRGFDVVTAVNAEEATRRVEDEKPDVVVLDIMMPEGIEGFQWLWKIRHHPDPAVKNVPVIVASSIHQTTSLRFHEGDADDTGDYLPVQAFFDKPIDPDDLERKIRSVLR